MQKLLQALHTITSTSHEAINELLSLTSTAKPTSRFLKSLTALVRQDFSFSDTNLLSSFHSLSLMQGPYTSDIVITKQMVREIILEPLAQSLALGKSIEYLARGRSQTVRAVASPDQNRKINFSALLSNETPGEDTIQK